MEATPFISCIQRLYLRQIWHADQQTWHRGGGGGRGGGWTGLMGIFNAVSTAGLTSSAALFDSPYIRYIQPYSPIDASGGCASSFRANFASNTDIQTRTYGQNQQISLLEEGQTRFFCFEKVV